MLYKNLFQLYPDNFQNNYFLLSDKLEDIRYLLSQSRREGLETEVGLGKHPRLAFLSSFLASNEENSLHKR